MTVSEGAAMVTVESEFHHLKHIHPAVLLVAMKFSRASLSVSVAALVVVSTASAATLTWDISPGGTTTTGNPIAGNGAITGGAGTWNNANAFWTTDGGVTDSNWDNVLNAGDTAAFQGTGATVTLGNAIDLAGLTFLSTGYTISSQSLVFGSAQGSINTSGLSAAGVTTISSALVGTGGLTLAANGDLSASGGGSSGLLAITGSNINLTGGIAITSGLVSFGSSSAAAGSILGTAGNGNTLTISNLAGIVANSTLTLGNNIVFSGGVSTLRAFGSATLTLNGAIFGAGGFNKTDAGIVVLNNSNNSFSGPVSIQDGTLSISSIKSMGGGASALGSIAAGDVADGTINIGSTTLGATLVYTGKGDTTDRVINQAGTTGGATLTQSGSGQLIFTGNITATGTGGAKTLTLNGSTAGTGEIAGSIFDSIGGLTSVTKSGTGLWTLSGTSIYTGATTVSAGTLNLTGSLTSAIAVASGATLTGSGSTSTSITLSSGSNLLVGNGVLTGSTVSATSVNVIPLASAVTATSPSGTPNNISIIGYTTTSPGTSGFNVSTFRNPSLTDTGSMIALSYTAATRTWAGSSGSWDNGTSLSWAEGDQLFYSGDAVTFGEIAADNIVSLAGTVAPSRITVSNATGAYTFSGTGSIVGSTGLTMNGTNSLTITTSNTYSGGTTINSGSVIAGSATALGSGAVSIGASGTLNVGAFTLANTISGSGTITSSVSAGNSQLNGDLSGFTGTLNVNTTAAGKFAVQATAPFASSAIVNVASGATFFATGPLTFSNNFNLSGTGNTENLGALRLDSGATVSGNVVLQSNASIGGSSGTGQISGVISESVAGTTLTKLGAGTIVLSGVNTYTGTTTITLGTLALATNNAINSNSPLAFSTSAQSTGVLGTLSIGGTSQQFSGLSVSYNPNNSTTSATAVINGAGTLTIQGSKDLNVTNNSSVTPGGSAEVETLDTTGLANFVYNAPLNKVIVLGMGNARSAVLSLGLNSTFTASSFELQNGNAGGNTGKTSTVNLGQNTTINANTIYVLNGNDRDGAAMQFQGGLTSPTLTIRATDGVSRAAWTIGSTDTSTVSTSHTAQVDLTTGIGGSSNLNALVSTLTLGSDTSGSNTLTAKFNMGGGTLDVTTLNVGSITSSGTLTSNFSVTGGTVKAQTLTLGARSNGTLTSTFSLNSGATLAAQTIQAGSGTGTRTFNWNSGTIKNYDGVTGLTIGSALTLAATGTHAFDISAGMTGTVNGVISEAAAGGSIVKSDNGTLILSAVNTYTGPTTVTGGGLVVSGSISGSATTVSGGSLSGTGSAGTVAVNSGGTLTPGSLTATGTLSTKDVTLAGTGALSLALNTSTLTSSTLAITGGLNLDLGNTSVLSLTDLGGGAVVPQNTVFTLATYTTSWNGGEFTFGGAAIPDHGRFNLGVNQFQLTYDSGTAGSMSVILTAVPEPGVAATLLGGFGMLLGLRRRSTRVS